MTTATEYIDRELGYWRDGKAHYACPPEERVEHLRVIRAYLGDGPLGQRYHKEAAEAWELEKFRLQERIKELEAQRNERGQEIHNMQVRAKQLKEARAHQQVLNKEETNHLNGLRMVVGLEPAPKGQWVDIIGTCDAVFDKIDTHEERQPAAGKAQSLRGKRTELAQLHKANARNTQRAREVRCEMESTTPMRPTQAAEDLHNAIYPIGSNEPMPANNEELCKLAQRRYEVLERELRETQTALRGMSVADHRALEMLQTLIGYEGESTIVDVCNAARNYIVQREDIDVMAAHAGQYLYGTDGSAKLL